jgi:hypothetical protein
MILLSTKDHHKPISADEFIMDRDEAMKNTQSSKYAFKYNYGGYIPADTQGKKLQKQILDFTEFEEFLSGKMCDFLPQMLFEEKKSREADNKYELDNKQRLRDIEENEQRVAALKKKEYMDTIFHPKKKTWNPQVLDYIHNRQKEINENIEAEIRESKVNFSSESNEYSLSIQKELEKLWTSLKMPLDQKLDMAVKYGYHDKDHIGKSILLWQNACRLIHEREDLLKEIGIFESKYSNPNRFFVKDYKFQKYDSFSKETGDREVLLRKLHSLGSHISELMQKIKTDLKEVVTYEGIPYTERMKRDYLEIVQRCAQE